VPIKKILSGTPPEEAASRGSLANPEILDHFAEVARARLAKPSESPRRRSPEKERWMEPKEGPQPMPKTSGAEPPSLEERPHAGREKADAYDEEWAQAAFADPALFLKDLNRGD